MKQVDCRLGITKGEGDRSWFIYRTDHFGTYCFVHNKQAPKLYKIRVFYLKPNNAQLLDQFTIEIWFSLSISYCMERNAKL